MENPVNNQIAEDYQQRSSALTEEARAKARVNALAISLGAAILGVMLNHIGNANLITC
jgi:hypothetical protein